MPLGEHSTIPAEIQALDLPDLRQVVLLGGGVLECAGIRRASDIDLVMPLTFHKLLLHRPGWQRERHYYKRENGQPFEVSSLRQANLEESKRPYDIWRWWYDPSRAPLGRIYFEELQEHSIQHELGFYILKLEYLRDLKSRTGREKDAADVSAIDRYRLAA